MSYCSLHDMTRTTFLPRAAEKVAPAAQPHGAALKLGAVCGSGRCTRGHARKAAGRAVLGSSRAILDTPFGDTHLAGRTLDIFFHKMPKQVLGSALLQEPG